VIAAAQLLNASEAAKQAGITVKALRIYEARGLIAPVRTAAGWRAYGPYDMARVFDIVRLRTLGLSLTEIARVLEGDSQVIAGVLTVHEAKLRDRACELNAAVQQVKRMRVALGRGGHPALCPISAHHQTAGQISVAFDLPWPWGGERFELRNIKPLTHIVGPLGSGKTRFAKRLAETVPGALFVGLDRLEGNGESARLKRAADPDVWRLVERAHAAIIDDGGNTSGALIALLVAVEADGAAVVVIDMLEQGLDAPTQEALIAHLRRRGADARPLLFVTRSTAILDLGAVGPEEDIIFCPANHGPPTSVAPYPGAQGYEAVASCLASPVVRARTEGMRAVRQGG
jgi:DNA-binding transcriptional MerR regulator